MKTHREGKKKVWGSCVHRCDDDNGVQQWKHPIPVAVNYTSPGPCECFRFCIGFVGNAVSLTHHANNSCSCVLSVQVRRSFKRMQ